MDVDRNSGDLSAAQRHAAQERIEAEGVRAPNEQF